MPAPTDVPMPGALDLQEGYTIRVTAVDPSTGAVVAGVTVGQVVLTVDDGTTTGVGPPPGELGSWQLVPGPSA